MDKERAKEILKIYDDGKHDLFNWCEEYKKYINDGVACCVSYEWDYMLKKSFEDKESPCDYEELNLNDFNQLKEEIIYKIEEEYKTKEEQNDLREEINLIKVNGGYLYIKEDESLKEFVEALNEEVFNLEIPQVEIYEWWILQGNLKYHLEQQGQIFLNGAWGRCSSGQSISLDYCCIKSFINWLRSW